MGRLVLFLLACLVVTSFIQLILKLSERKGKGSRASFEADINAVANKIQQNKHKK